MTDAFHYTGELRLFEKAVRWKTYWSAQVRPFIGRRVLDVGAGLGSSARLLCGGPVQSWLFLEPDPALVAANRQQSFPAQVEIRQGVLQDLAAGEQFETILYADVLEHIREDGAEVALAADHLAPGGRLVALVPAHQWLYTEFDAAVGHHRRYDRESLEHLRPAGLRTVVARYLDAVGMLASAANRVFLRSAHPSESQILVWDRLMVPLSRLIDPLLGWRWGKSILVVWEKPGP